MPLFSILFFFFTVCRSQTVSHQTVSELQKKKTLQKVKTEKKDEDGRRGRPSLLYLSISLPLLLSLHTTLLSTAAVAQTWDRDRATNPKRQ
jgi:hypothetical protein